MRLLSLFAACCVCLAAQAQVPELGRWQDLDFAARDVHLRYAFAYQAQLLDLASREKLDDDPALLARAQKIVARLAHAATRLKPQSAPWQWEVHVTSDPSVEALCMAGGKLLLGSRFVAQLRLDDGELATLLSHEMAHALADHHREMLSSAHRINPLPATSVDVLMLQLDSDWRLHVRLARLAFIQEREADQLGMLLAHRAGWPAQAMLRFYEKLQASEQPSALSMSHPDAAARVSMAKGMARLLGDGS